MLCRKYESLLRQSVSNEWHVFHFPRKWRLWSLHHSVRLSRVHQKWLVQEELLSFIIPDIFHCLQIFFCTFFWHYFSMNAHTHTDIQVHWIFIQQLSHSTSIMSQTFVLHLEILPPGKIDSDAKTPTAGGSWRWVMGVNSQTWCQNFAFGSVTHCKTEQGWDEKQRGAKGLHWFLQTFLFSFLLPFDFFFRSLLFFFYCRLPFLPLHFFVFSPSSFLGVCLKNSVLHCGSSEPLGHQPSDCLFTTSPRGLSVWHVCTEDVVGKNVCTPLTISNWSQWEWKRQKKEACIKTQREGLHHMKSAAWFLTS